MSEEEKAVTGNSTPKNSTESLPSNESKILITTTKAQKRKNLKEDPQYSKEFITTKRAIRRKSRRIKRIKKMRIILD